MRDGFDFPIERGKVDEFCRATLPLLAAAGVADIVVDADNEIAPIVFSRVADFHHPRGASISELLGRSPASLRHAGHSWQSVAPLRVGESYRVLGWTITDRVEKTSRDGASFTLVTAERIFLDAGGTMVLREETVIAALDDTIARRRDAATVAGDDQATGEAILPKIDWRAAAPTTLLADITVPPLSLMDFVRFAGAIGDFNAIHHDRDAAQANGLPDIIAMGMLNCALAAALSEWAFGAGALESLTVRFKAPLFAKQSLRMQAWAAPAGREAGPTAKIEGSSGAREILSVLSVARQ